ncbi:MAG: hypothetical protein LBP72_00805 [Dysgonamonadaceae bacterium]|jgi:hypothetical protein|nr:hypothetical protein [Dysgonamonadaceae bacterium]
MKSLTVRKIDFSGCSAGQLSGVMDRESVAYQNISEINWDKYPYRPEARFRIAHDGKRIFLHYRVEEESIRALYGEDNEAVWTDSCVEFFVRFPKDDFYYNLESNCIGTVLLGARKNRNESELASRAITQTIERASSLGREPFALRKGTHSWDLSLIVPASVFFKNSIRNLSGTTAYGNFYKCGDELLTPHFLSWNNIENPEPNFHLPAFFGELLFE